MYVLHAQSPDGKAFPCLYALLTDKTQASYDKVFDILKEYADKGPEFVVVDLELAPMNCYRKYWPEAVVEGCEFHVRRALQEQMATKGVLPAYNADTHLQYVIDLIHALMFVPYDQIVNVYEKVVEPLVNKTITALENGEGIDDHEFHIPSKYDNVHFPVQLTDYFTYLENFYIGAMNRSGKRRKPAYPPDVWSKYNAVLAGRYRTSNSAENWHAQIQSSINKLASIWKFVDWLSQVSML